MNIRHNQGLIVNATPRINLAIGRIGCGEEIFLGEYKRIDYKNLPLICAAEQAARQKKVLDRIIR